MLAGTRAQQQARLRGDLTGPPKAVRPRAEECLGFISSEQNENHRRPNRDVERRVRNADGLPLLVVDAA